MLREERRAEAIGRMDERRTSRDQRELHRGHGYHHEGMWLAVVSGGDTRQIAGGIEPAGVSAPV